MIDPTELRRRQAFGGEITRAEIDALIDAVEEARALSIDIRAALWALPAPFGELRKALNRLDELARRLG